ncbi:MAG: hypothetical protein K9M45_05480, partial [Kiritimatiellales bacterium]|nr:hypothetical protein [Kiritimatiellales bacterium]
GKVETDKATAAEIKMLANNLKNGTGILQGASFALLQQLIDNMNSQARQIETLKGQIRGARY